MARMDKTVGYRLALLDPRAEPAVQLHLLGPATLGIEVTVPVLAAACGLGNIDPQHGPGGDGRAAIEAALDWPMPPPGTLLVTIRPDLDSVGAMAVLGMRAAGEPIGPDACVRIDQIARADRHDRGAWPGPRPLASLWTEPTPLAAPALLVADAGLDLSERVAGLRHWLATGQTAPRYCEKAVAGRREMAAALHAGTLRVRSLRGGRIAVVVGGRAEALRLGYCLAPVVVALNPAFRPAAGGEPYRKFTVAQYRAGHADFAGLRQVLALLEPGWGGSATILGSPQGASSQLSLTPPQLPPDGICNRGKIDRRSRIREQRFVDKSAQPEKRLGRQVQPHVVAGQGPASAIPHRLSVTVEQRDRQARSIVEIACELRRLGLYQHMRHRVGRPSEQRHRIGQQRAHRLASAGDRGVDDRLGKARQVANGVGDHVGGADSRHRCGCRIAARRQHHAAIRPAASAARQRRIQRTARRGWFRTQHQGRALRLSS